MRHQVPAAMIVTSSVDAEAIRAILERVRHFINHLLHHLVRAFPYHPPTHETACLTLNRREDERFVFLQPTNVNSSSSSICSGVCVGLAGSSGTRSAACLNQAITVAWVTPACRAADRKLLPSSTMLMASCLASWLAPTGVGLGVVTRLHVLHTYFWLPLGLKPFLIIPSPHRSHFISPFCHYSLPEPERLRGCVIESLDSKPESEV